ncbi:FkbM family methyltransferase [Cribrihabitans pelagius]|uniref:FkbM family methyltransferase n=1 Tax=Cribrihabitans pelagius TaxID=1765746 RepID=UPI003B5CE158
MGLSDTVIYKDQAQGCIADIHSSVTADTFEVVFNARNCHLEIAENCHFKALRLYFLSDNTRVRIGTGTLCRSSFWANLSGAGRTITVGDHCLIASVKMRTSDSHHIIDLESGKMVNPAGDISIGDHVWIAEDVLVLKGSSIGTGAAIGARAMVSGNIPGQCLAAGTPAKVLRKGITWRYSAGRASPLVPDPDPVPDSAPDSAPPAELASAAAPCGPETGLEETALPAPAADFWQKLRKHLAPAAVREGDRLAAQPWRGKPEPAARQKTRFLNMLLKGESEISLKGGPFRFRKTYDLAVQLEEIICNVQYNFDAASEKPFIIDAGGCYGLASYLLNRRHPGAEILAFEPNPANAAVFRENIARTGMANVTLEEAAAGTSTGTTAFYANADMPMGSSTSSRLSDLGHETEQLTVRQVDLPGLIAGRQVDFLKLDVEGAEYGIIEALDGRMDGIRNMFIELHFGTGLPKSNLARLLGVLDRNGFDHMITRAGNASPPHPLNAPEQVWGGSLNLWARRP